MNLVECWRVDLPSPGIEPVVSSALAGRFFITEPPGMPTISFFKEKIRVKIYLRTAQVMGTAGLSLESGNFHKAPFPTLLL